MYVSTDGGPPEKWLDATIDTSATFTGAAGHTYAFFTVATDDVGNVEAASATADAETTLVAGANVGGLVWNDLNSNGVQDPGESGVAGAVVRVFSSVDNQIGNSDDAWCGVTSEDGTGRYTLSGLLPDVNYYLVFQPPAGYTFTTPHAGGDTTRDSDADANGRSGLFMLAAGQSDVILDAGLVGTSPSFGWALHAGDADSSAAHYGTDVAVDAGGAIYVTGFFDGTVDFDPGPGTYELTSAGGIDAFVAKYSSAGLLLWAGRLGGTDYDQGLDLALGSDGRVYLTGQFSGKADLDPGPGTYWRTSAGLTDVFVVKLNSQGQLDWVRTYGGTDSDEGSGVAVAASGEVLVTGTFLEAVDFDPGPGTYQLYSGGGAAQFVEKLSADGNFVWAREVSGTDACNGAAVAVGGDGSVYTTGGFSGTADFNPGTGTLELSSPDEMNAFVSKLTPSGDFAWARVLGAGATGEAGVDLAVAPDGSVVTTGYFSGTGDFGPGGASYLLDSGDQQAAFISKLDAAGNFVWAGTLTGTGGAAGLSIALGADQSVYTTGYFGGTVDFDPRGGVANLTSAGRTFLPNVFVSKLNAAGDFVWARALGGEDGAIGHGIAVARDGSVVTTGAFEKAADFDPGPGTLYLTSTGSADIFVSELNSPAASLALTPATIPEGRPAGWLVGTFSTPDLGTGETFTYALSAGAGDTDNGSFEIAGDQLQTATVLDYETQGTHSIRVRLTDAHEAWYERVLQVTVLNVAPTVTIDRATAQDDPTNQQPIYFTVIFSEPVVGFSAEDVVLTGTAPGARVENLTGSSTTYQVQVGGLTGHGSVIAAISASAAHDGGGAPNSPATSSDSTVTFLPWTNVVNPCDVDASDSVTPLDVLILINRINGQGAGELSGLRPTNEPWFVDVTKDAQLTPIDVLTVINYINSAGGQQQGESESPASGIAPGLATGGIDAAFAAADAPVLGRVSESPHPQIWEGISSEANAVADLVPGFPSVPWVETPRQVGATESSAQPVIRDNGLLQKNAHRQVLAEGDARRWMLAKSVPQSSAQTPRSFHANRHSVFDDILDQEDVLQEIANDVACRWSDVSSMK